MIMYIMKSEKVVSRVNKEIEEVESKNWLYPLSLVRRIIVVLWKK